MSRLLLCSAFICFARSVSAESNIYETYLLPEHRSSVIPYKSIKGLPSNDYEFHIVPSDEYALAEYEDPRDSLSLFDVIPVPNPITAVSNIASRALSAGAWLLSNSGFIIFGAALVVGFCAFTSYCTLVIEEPLTAHIRSYIDDVEYMFRQAYEKYHK
ncbi:hypothetical protein evm_001698 [Chilo suppressalis]|nr:hypothetical protein evm_001698 [Chilo suppressalis]